MQHCKISSLEQKQNFVKSLPLCLENDWNLARAIANFECSAVLPDGGWQFDRTAPDFEVVPDAIVAVYDERMSDWLTRR